METKRRKRAVAKGIEGKVVEDAPSSAISAYPTYEDELSAANGDLDTVNIIEVDRRLALLARIILEGVMREGRGVMSPKDRGDLALRTISTLEGVKARTELWVRESDVASLPRTMEELERETREVEARLRKLLERDAQGTQREDAEAALQALQLGLNLKLPEA